MPPDKSFETTIPFVEVPGDGWYPIIWVTFVRPRAPNLQLPLLLDTGADQIFLHPDWERAFSNLKDAEFGGIGGKVRGKNTQGQVEVFGQLIDCDVGFGPKEMESRTWMAGVLGRNCFKPFGFGFWENTRELYVTARP